MECEEGEAALFSDPLAGVLAGDKVLQECRDYAMVSEGLPACVLAHEVGADCGRG
jgi:hypothetical protein